MGIFKGIGSLLDIGSPNRPRPAKFQTNAFMEDPRFNERLQGSEGAYYDSLQRHLNREPGFSKEELHAMYQEPAEQTKGAETIALRRLNQGAAYRGGYHGGARERGRGDILAAGMSTRASLRRQTLAEAARVALEDRYRQLDSWSRYTDPRLAASLGYTQGKNAHALGRDSLRNQQYLADLQSYDQWGQAMLEVATRAASGGFSSP